MLAGNRTSRARHLQVQASNRHRSLLLQRGSGRWPGKPLVLAGQRTFRCLHGGCALSAPVCCVLFLWRSA